MKLLLCFISFCHLYTGILACFEEHPLESNLQEYLALKKSCSDTLFPEPPCCGNSTGSVSRIINGESTGLRELTWTVYINITYEKLSPKSIDWTSCGGSLLNTRWVLSAAHCFVHPEIRFIKEEVHIGEWNITSDPDCVERHCAPNVEKINVAQVIRHPDYKGEILWTNDLALLRLEHPVAYSEFINPICLPFNPLEKKCFENQRAITAGWGRTAFRGNFSPVKLQTTLSIWQTDKCEGYESSFSVTLHDKYHICASAGQNSSCHGDSGGPLSIKLQNSDHNYLVGAVAGGSGTCNAAKHPAIFARIDFKWIVDVILNTEYRS